MNLASFISAEQTFQDAGYSGPVTTTEPINVCQSSGSAQQCGAIDILGANIHPFFNSEVTASQAENSILHQIDILKNSCLGIGWPSKGAANGLAVPDPALQSEAIKSPVTDVGAISVFFSFSNDAWKAQMHSTWSSGGAASINSRSKLCRMMCRGG